MGPYLIALLCLCAAMSELASAGSSSQAWRLYKRQHGKVYGSEEEAMRFANFLATKQLVEQHNANPKSTFKMGLNHMSDWTREEQEQLMGFRMSEAQRMPNAASMSSKLAKLLDGPVPKEVDWREVPNRVSSVKNQYDCGAGWAFATTGLLEGQQAVRNISELIPLSEQELIDCSTSNSGCYGGRMDDALEDLAKLGGIESEADYPYVEFQDKCQIKKDKFVMTVKGAVLLDLGDEDGLLKAVANYGPVAVSIAATSRFINYKSGILDDPYCEIWPLNHHVLVVGYGTDAKDGDYWIVKNSAGNEWGENGYLRMKRGVNQCGIAQLAVLADF